jgi:hypothetical protein
MKKMLMLAILFSFGGAVLFSGCSDNGGKKINPPEDKVTIMTNMTYGSEYTYSLSNPPALPPITNFIGFAIGVSKDGSSISVYYGDITWTSTGVNVGILSPVLGTSGAELNLNGTTGTTVVKATYLIGTIDEMFATVTIHVVP